MNPNRAFLTGEPGCGKTTAVRKLCYLLTARGRKVGGVVSTEIRERGMRVGFTLEDLASHEVGCLAHVNQAEGPRVGKYRVNLADIERIAAHAITRAIAESDVIVVDELGPMELNSKPFVTTVEVALATPKPFVGTIHKHASHYLIAAIKTNPTYRILEVTDQNRDALPNTLLESFENQAS